MHTISDQRWQTQEHAFTTKEHRRTCITAPQRAPPPRVVSLSLTSTCPAWSPGCELGGPCLRSGSLLMDHCVRMVGRLVCVHAEGFLKHFAPSLPTHPPTHTNTHRTTAVAPTPLQSTHTHLTVVLPLQDRSFPVRMLWHLTAWTLLLPPSCCCFCWCAPIILPYVF